MKNAAPLFERIAAITDKNVFKQRTGESLEWYRKKMFAEFGDKNIDPIALFDKNKYPNKPQIGNIVTFRYNPKLANTLPYYDLYPLVLILKILPDGFLGLNFHYLSPKYRAWFMDRLYKYQTFSKQDETFKINMSYKILKGTSKLSMYKPCIKRYRNRNIGNMFYTVLPSEWDFVLFLPTEKFVGAKKQKVWKDSENEIS